MSILYVVLLNGFPVKLMHQPGMGGVAPCQSLIEAIQSSKTLLKSTGYRTLHLFENGKYVCKVDKTTTLSVIRKRITPLILNPFLIACSVGPALIFSMGAIFL